MRCFQVKYKLGISRHVHGNYFLTKFISKSFKSESTFSNNTLEAQNVLKGFSSDSIRERTSYHWEQSKVLLPFSYSLCELKWWTPLLLCEGTQSNNTLKANKESFSSFNTFEHVLTSSFSKIRPQRSTFKRKTDQLWIYNCWISNLEFRDIYRIGFRLKKYVVSLTHFQRG